MKIHETKRNDLSEGPLDFLSKSNRDQKAAFKQGQQTLRDTANNLMRQFAEYLGSKGVKSYDQASTEDVINFLKSKKANTSDINPDMPMDTPRIKQIFVDKAKKAIQGGDAAPQATFKSQRGQAKGQFKSQRPAPNPEFKSQRVNMPPEVAQGIKGMSNRDKLRLGQQLVKKYGG